MAKMTKEAAKELLTNRKVYVNGKSKEIQEKLFECGFKWADGKVRVENTHAPFLYIEESILHGSNMVNFGMCKAKEISAEEILSIEIEEGFNDGDFIFGGLSDRVAIYHSTSDCGCLFYHACTDLLSGCIIAIPSSRGIGCTKEYSIATPEKRQELIDELAKKGKRWNAEKKCIEDLPKELKPFDRVLVRELDDKIWECDIFSHLMEGHTAFHCVGYRWEQCIPYEGNENLLGTTNKPE